MIAEINVPIPKRLKIIGKIPPDLNEDIVKMERFVGAVAKIKQRPESSPRPGIIGTGHSKHGSLQVGKNEDQKYRAMPTVGARSTS